MSVLFLLLVILLTIAGLATAVSQRQQQQRWCVDDDEVREKFRVVFVVGLGRSGTSEVVDEINSLLPRHNISIRVSGENQAALSHLRQFYTALTNAREKLPVPLEDRLDPNWGRWSDGLLSYLPSHDYSAWFNVFDLQEVRASLQRLFMDVWNPNCTYQVVGFKEIRWAMYRGFEKEAKDDVEKGRLPNVPHLENDIAFCKFLFPNTRFVRTHRPLDLVANSSWWKQDNNRDRDRVATFLKYHQQSVDSLFADSELNQMSFNISTNQYSNNATWCQLFHHILQDTKYNDWKCPSSM